MSVLLLQGSDSEEETLCCDLCGRRQPVDATLPYVNQAASFALDHSCGEVEGDGPGQC